MEIWSDRSSLASRACSRPWPWVPRRGRPRTRRRGTATRSSRSWPSTATPATATGSKKGNVALDGFADRRGAAGHDRELWYERPQERPGRHHAAGRQAPAVGRARCKALEDWIKRGVFGIDPADPDPGRVTLRRLNRVEYRNTIRDLMGIDFQADEEFPADDTGYGFDNIGDVLTRLAPAARKVHAGGRDDRGARPCPRSSEVVRSRPFAGRRVPRADGGGAGERLSFYKAATVAHDLQGRRGRAPTAWPSS